MCSIELEMLVTYNPCYVHDDDTLEQAEQLFAEFGLHHVPVVNAQRELVGVLSDGELLRAATQRSPSASQGLPRPTGEPGAEQLRVRDFMISRVMTASSGDTVAEVLERMLTARIHSLPFVEGKHLVGIITSSDIVREFAYCDAALAHLPLRDLVESVQETVEDSATLTELEAFLVSNSASHVLVTHGECPLGIVSRRDIRRARTQLSLQSVAADHRVEPLARMLIKKAPPVSPGASLAKAAAMMAEYGSSAVIAMQGSHRILGILSEDRLLAELHSEWSGVSDGVIA